MGRRSKFGCGSLLPPSERGSNKLPGEYDQAPVIGSVLETHHFADGSRQHVVDWREMGRGR